MRAGVLFAGASGACLGMRDAGVEHVIGIEWDESAAATSRAAGFPTVCGDVRNLELLADVGEFDLWWSSFPCQDFSTAGKRKGAKGERNGWPWTVAVLDHRPSRWFIAENVRGLTLHVGDCPTRKGKVNEDPEACPRCYLDRVIMADLRARYAWADWRIIDAADLGVPQRRRRVAIVAGPRPIEWPEATHSGEALAVAKWGTGEYWREFASPSEVLVDSSQTSERAGGRIPARTSGDAPSPTVRAQEGVGLGLVCGSGLKGSTDTADAPSYTLRDGNGAAGLYLEPGPVGTPSAQEARWLKQSRQIGLFGAPPRFNLKPWRTVRQALGLSGTLEASRNTDANPTQERPQTTDEPIFAVGGKGNQYLSPRVLGGGHNPNTPTDGDARTLRDITDEPSTTIAAQTGGGAGNAGPFVVGMLERNSGTCGLTPTPLDAPSPTVLAGSNRDNGLRFVESRAGTEPGRLDAPSLTVTTTEVKGSRAEGMGAPLANGGKSGGPDRASDGLWLATGRRRLAIHECAALQDFPADHPWQGNKTSIYRQIGNAVPPTWARVLCEAVMRADKESQ